MVDFREYQHHQLVIQQLSNLKPKHVLCSGFVFLQQPCINLTQYHKGLSLREKEKSFTSLKKTNRKVQEEHYQLHFRVHSPKESSLTTYRWLFLSHHHTCSAINSLQSYILAVKSLKLYEIKTFPSAAICSSPTFFTNGARLEENHTSKIEFSQLIYKNLKTMKTKSTERRKQTI